MNNTWDAPTGDGNDIAASPGDQSPANEATEESKPEPQDAGGLDGILRKYDNDPHKLAAAYKALQQQQSKQQAPPPVAPMPGMATAEQQEGLMAAAARAVGGEQQFNALSDWATQRIQAGDQRVTEAVEAFQAGIQTGDVQRAQGALAQVQLGHMQRYGWQPAPQLGQVGMGASSRDKALVSQADINEVYKDPRMNIHDSRFDEKFYLEQQDRIALY